ncbi:MAG: DUF2723 domain-containing protein [Anaerolineae bacterium]|nr:DUF2723 domain-containing protein [Anaerolineae bacterium]
MKAVEERGSKGAGEIPPLPPCLPAPLRLQFILTGSLFVVSLLLYLSTLAPSVVTLFDDSLEFQLVTYQLGIAHPTGYPLYTLLGKLFTWLPVGNIAYRVNLMSAVFGAVTISLVYLLTLQIRRASAVRETQAASETWLEHLSALSGALFLAVSLVFWQQATIAEVYTLNAFFVALLLLVAVAPRDTRSKILWLAFIAGLSLTHHRTVLLLMPALALYLYGIAGSTLFKKSILLPATLLSLAPLLLYLYLPLRGHVGSLDGSYENSWAGFWQHVSGGGYGTFIFDNPFNHERGLAFYWSLLNGQFYTLLFALIGLISLARRGQWLILLLTGGAFLSYLGFNLLYQVTDIDVFFIPNFLILAGWSGLGVAKLLSWGEKLPTHFGQYLLRGVIFIGVAWAIYQPFQANRSQVSEGYAWQVHDYGLDMLQQPLPTEAEGGATIIGIVGEMTLLRYFQQTDNRRPDIQTVAADAEADRFTAITAALAAGRAVYLTRELSGAAERWSLSAVGPLIAVNPEPVTTPSANSMELPITPEIKLLDYHLSHPPHTGPGPPPVRLTLTWQATAKISSDLKVSARLIDLTGQQVAVTDVEPVHFAYPTSAWRVGEVVTDVYDLTLPNDTPPGQYTPLLIWYDPAQNAAEVGRIELEPLMIYD